MSAERLAGRVAVVTGASRGIGLGIAQRIVDEGGRVCITGRTEETLAEAVDQLGGRERAIGVAGRTDDPDHQSEAVGRTLEAFGPVTMLVNNTGINPASGSLLALDPAMAHKMLDVNCLAALGWISRVHQAGLAEHGGAIVNIGSTAGLRPTPGLGFYGATKAMLEYLTRTLALELGPQIRVNGVAPGVVKTKFASSLFEGREDEVAEQYPLKRLGVADDIASAVAFLLSSDSSWITGRTLTVDGGVTLR
ncbi:SDR family oxidoreductase [Aeromicrobium sp. P5_D10]